MINGIDISKHQGVIDWSRVAKDPSDIQFAFVKATEGDYRDPYVDPLFVENWEQARYHLPHVGAYHFARRSKDADGSFLKDAEREAVHFCNTVGTLSPGDIDPVLDIEWDKRSKKYKFTARETVQWCKRFCEVLELDLGRRPIIYTGKNFWKYKLGKSDALFDYTFWNARPTNNPRRTSPSLKVPGWKTTFWQHSWRGRVQGIRGPVDLNRFMGTAEELRTYAGNSGTLYPVPALTIDPSNPIYSDALAFVIEYFQPAKPRRAA